MERRLLAVLPEYSRSTKMVYKSAFLLSMLSMIGCSKDNPTAAERPDRALAVTLSSHAHSTVYRQGNPILIDLELSNGLGTDVGFLSYSLAPLDWNGETVGVHLTDVYRDEDPMGKFLKRPDVTQPHFVAGVGRERVAPGSSKIKEIDISKWQIVGGWAPGRYSIQLELSGVDIDAHTTARISAEPITIQIEK